MTLSVRRARVDEIFPLRHAVLRPGLPVSYSVYSEDDDAVHVGAWAGPSTPAEGGALPMGGGAALLVGCATVFPDPWPGPPAEPAAWRLRGMAVDPEWQGRGVGAEVLVEAISAARQAGAPLLWANARTSALGFYRTHGFQTVGEEFITPDTGLPHHKIVLDLQR